MNEPINLACGHRFCFQCISYYRKSFNNCPTCTPVVHQNMPAPTPQQAIYPQNFTNAQTLPQWMLPGASWGSLRIAQPPPQPMYTGDPNIHLSRDQLPVQHFNAVPTPFQYGGMHNGPQGTITPAQQIYPFSFAPNMGPAAGEDQSRAQQQGGLVAVAPRPRGSSSERPAQTRSQEPEQQIDEEQSERTGSISK